VKVFVAGWCVSTLRLHHRVACQPDWIFLPERVDIDSLIIRGPVFPAAINDPDPPVGESTDRRMMVFPLISFVVVIAPGPIAIPDRLCRKLMKALLHKLRTGKPSVYPLCFSAAFRHRRNARVLGQVQRGTEAASIGSHYCKQARRQGKTST
jgi:hypothetical protein